MYRNKGVSNADKPEYALVYRKREKTELEKFAPALTAAGVAGLTGTGLLVNRFYKNKQEIEPQLKEQQEKKAEEGREDAKKQERAKNLATVEELEKTLKNFKVAGQLDPSKYETMTTDQLKKITDNELARYQKLIDQLNSAHGEYSKSMNRTLNDAYAEPYQRILDNIKSLRELKTSVSDLIGSDAKPGVLKLRNTTKLKQLLGNYETALDVREKLRNLLNKTYPNNPVVNALADNVDMEALGQYFDTLPVDFNILREDVESIPKATLRQFVQLKPSKRKQEIAEYLIRHYESLPRFEKTELYQEYVKSLMVIVDEEKRKRKQQ